MSKIETAIASVATQGITCIKNADNPYFNSRYADLGTVVKALAEPLKAAGLSYYFRTTPINEVVESDNKVMIKTWVVELVVLTDDEQVIVPFPFSQSDPQKMGSAITYAKRYLLTTVFNVIAEEDDDGNEASDNKPKVTKKKPTVMTDAPKPNFF